MKASIKARHHQRPHCGKRALRGWLVAVKGFRAGIKRVARMMRELGIKAVASKPFRPNTSQPGAGHRLFPYLLRKLRIVRPNQVWAADITYLPMLKGHLYLVSTGIPAGCCPGGCRTHWMPH